MNCLCGHGESCIYCDAAGASLLQSKDNEIKSLKKSLEDISKYANDVMAEPNMPAKALLSFRWLKKLALRGLGESED